ncbi:hypothetical protein OSTOST_06719 [Ostertagia ostertagi]
MDYDRVSSSHRGIRERSRGDVERDLEDLETGLGVLCVNEETLRTEDGNSERTHQARGADISSPFFPYTPHLGIFTMLREEIYQEFTIILANCIDGTVQRRQRYKDDIQ